MADLSQMSMDELLKFQADIEEVMKSKKAEELKSVQEELLLLDHKAQQLGSSALELLGSKGGKATKAKAPAKYAHPENPAETWSGRGRYPEWVKDHIENGGDKDDFLIKKD
ncbi:H-NS family nucleoid-associated regulatory protein [Tritonibacter mobilis]|uniref:H-NS histone family protein n=1 Tax=Tritonibacter mobilis TaxID=379347 RepID=UPI000806821D|nr:H-NS histone family protein [Tritonibacter mobilis]